MKATDATSDIYLALLVGLRILGWPPAPHYTAAQQIADAEASGDSLSLLLAQLKCARDIRKWASSLDETSPEFGLIQDGTLRRMLANAFSLNTEMRSSVDEFLALPALAPYIQAVQQTAARAAAAVEQQHAAIKSFIAPFMAPETHPAAVYERIAPRLEAEGNERVRELRRQQEEQRQQQLLLEAQHLQQQQQQQRQGQQQGMGGSSSSSRSGLLNAGDAVVDLPAHRSPMAAIGAAAAAVGGGGGGGGGKAPQRPPGLNSPPAHGSTPSAAAAAGSAAGADGGAAFHRMSSPLAAAGAGGTHRPPKPRIPPDFGPLTPPPPPPASAAPPAGQAGASPPAAAVLNLQASSAAAAAGGGGRVPPAVPPGLERHRQQWQQQRSVASPPAAAAAAAAAAVPQPPGLSSSLSSEAVRDSAMQAGAAQQQADQQRERLRALSLRRTAALVVRPRQQQQQDHQQQQQQQQRLLDAGPQQQQSSSPAGQVNHPAEPCSNETRQNPSVEPQVQSEGVTSLTDTPPEQQQQQQQQQSGGEVVEAPLMTAASAAEYHNCGTTSVHTVPNSSSQDSSSGCLVLFAPPRPVALSTGPSHPGDKHNQESGRSGSVGGGSVTAALCGRYTSMSAVTVTDWVVTTWSCSGAVAAVCKHAETVAAPAVVPEAAACVPSECDVVCSASAVAASKPHAMIPLLVITAGVSTDSSIEGENSSAGSISCRSFLAALPETLW